MFLTHPGPSILVTAVVVAAAGLLTRQLPSLRTALGLTFVMLPAQLAIGALNDWADVASDSVSKPFKPIVRGGVPRGAALALAVAGFAVSLATAAWLGAAVLGVAVLGAGAGAVYDLGLKRHPAAVLAWWAGLAAVPLLAMALTGRAQGAAAIVPLAGLLALALLIANGQPDVEGDSAAGGRTLPAVLGPARSLWVMEAALFVAAAGVVAARPALGQDGLALLGALVLAAGAMAAWLLRGHVRLVFPVVAVVEAVAAVSWLAALPAPGPG